MQCVGKVLHMVSRGRVLVEGSRMVKPRTRLYDAQRRQVGEVADVIGPVQNPWLVVSPAREVRATRLVGRELFRR